MTAAEQLDALAVWFDLDRLVGWLTADAEHPALAVAWLHERAELFGEHPYGESSYVDPELGARRLWFETYVRLSGGTPAAVAREVRWPFLELVLRGGDGWPAARDLARGRGAGWVADLAARVAGRTSSHTLLAPLLRELGLPVPVGAGFLQGWVSSLPLDDAPAVAAVLRSEPQVVSLVEQYLASDLVRAQPPVARALPALVAEGRLERRWLLDLVLQRLTTPSRPSVQRELAGLLTATDVRLDDLPGGTPFAATLLATCHGSVGAVVLPLLLDAVTDPAELVELAMTLAARPEKAQRQTLLRALRRPALRERVGVEAVREALDVLGSTSDDLALVAQVAAARDALPGPAGPVEPVEDEPLHVAGWWTLRPPGTPPVAGPLREAGALTQAQARALCLSLRDGRNSEYHAVDPARELELDSLVRTARQVGVPKVAAWLRDLVRDHAEAPHRIGEGMAGWAADGSPESYAAARRQVGPSLPDPATGHHVGPFSLWGPVTAMPYLRAREALLGLGELGCLLATPTRADHTVAFDALVARLRLNDGGVVGALDLLQALLRLQPVDPARARELTGVGVRVEARLPADETPAGPPLDAVVVVQAWVDAGGVPDPRWVVSEAAPHEGVSFWRPGGQLPVPEALLELAPRGLFRFDVPQGSPAAWAGVLPAWPDLCLAPGYALSRPGHMSDGAGLLPALVGGELGLPAYDLLLKGLVSTDRRNRLEAAQTVLQLVGQDRFDPARCATAALMRLEAGVLPLARFSAVLEVTASTGGLAAVWPVVTAVADAACGAPRPPAGTVDLLRVLAEVAHEVPDPVLPPAVTAFAGRGGTSGAVLEARRLLALTTSAGAA